MRKLNVEEMYNVIGFVEEKIARVLIEANREGRLEEVLAALGLEGILGANND